MTHERFAPGAITLGRAFSMFITYPTAQIIIPFVAAAWVARAVLGGWQWWDLGIIAIVCALEAFTEWVTHVFVLHFKPREIFGRRIDPYIARKHRAHHADPKQLRLVFVPLPVFLQLIVADPIIMYFAIPDHGLALTAIAATFTMLGTYEWTHFLIHSTYRPKGRYYTYIRRAHWLHHYKNENYWFGITVHFADHLFGTFPAKSDVDSSPTARTLGVN